MYRRSWTEKQDRELYDYVCGRGACHWDAVAKAIGVGKSGNSCRLRWFNYLSPEVRRGNMTDQELLVILYRHYQLGNKWSQIAKELPGRTDNEIKNFWNTRVKKEAKQMGLQVESREFHQQMIEKIQGHTMNDAAEHDAFTTTLPPPAPNGGGGVATLSSSSSPLTEIPDSAAHFGLDDQAPGYLDSWFAYPGFIHLDFPYNPDGPPSF